MASDPLDDVRRAVTDTVYIGVGLGLITVQALQVRRRELERRFGVDGPPSLGDLPRVLDRLPGRR